MSDTKLPNLIDDFDSSIVTLENAISEIIIDKQSDFGDKIDAITLGQASLLALSLRDLSPDPRDHFNRAPKVNQVNAMLKTLQDSLYRKRELEGKEEIDVSHPKIQKVLGWLVEMVLESMRDLGYDESTRLALQHTLSTKIVGFEEAANKKLKGVAFPDLDDLENPLKAN